ncbi:hypothetical protein ALQ32_200135 [Pseudomonas syringae pv. tagetis]|uniref:Uncharacterized protein n=1 Tax=Pseudomonas syringae pv. tagetis TaxID=129140 RepID=A0A3M3ZFR8_9PSED|nr:hypothetical protein ALQ32_200135 [Pseudomonas syringae pv. tagetis]
MRSFYSKEKHCLPEKSWALENPTLVQWGWKVRVNFRTSYLRLRGRL